MWPPLASSLSHFLQWQLAHIPRGLHLAESPRVSRAYFGPAWLPSGEPGTRLGSKREAKNSPKEETSFAEGRGAGPTEPQLPLHTLPLHPQIPPTPAPENPGPFPILWLFWEALNSNCGSPAEQHTYWLSSTLGPSCGSGHFTGHVGQLWGDGCRQTLCQVTLCGRLQWQRPRSGRTRGPQQAP